MNIDDYNECWHSDTREASGIEPLPYVSVEGLEPTYNHNSPEAPEEYKINIVLQSTPSFLFNDIPTSEGICLAKVYIYEDNVEGARFGAEDPPEDLLTQESPRLISNGGYQVSQVVFCPGENKVELNLEIPKSIKFHGTTKWKIAVIGSYNCQGQFLQSFSVYDYDIQPAHLPPWFGYLEGMSDEDLCRHLDVRQASGIDKPDVNISCGSYFKHDSAKRIADGERVKEDYKIQLTLDSNPTFMLEGVDIGPTGIVKANVTIYNKNLIEDGVGVLNDKPLHQKTPTIYKSDFVFCPGENKKEFYIDIPKSHIFHGSTYWIIQASGGWNTNSGIVTQEIEIGDYDIQPKVKVFNVSNDYFYKKSEEDQDPQPLHYNEAKSVVGGSQHNSYGDVTITGDPATSYPSGTPNLIWFKLRREGRTVQDLSINYDTVLPTSRGIKVKEGYESPISFPSGVSGIFEEIYLPIEIPEEEMPKEGKQDVEVKLQNGDYYYLDEKIKFNEAKSAFLDSHEENKIFQGEKQKTTLFREPPSGITTTTTTTTLPPQLKREFGSYGSASNPSLPQHVFLGASVADFSLNGGFGDSVTTMNVTLVEDSVVNSVHKKVDKFGRRQTVTGTSYIGQEQYATTTLDEEGNSTSVPGYTDTSEYQDIEVGDPVFFCFGESLQKPMTGHNTSHIGGPDSNNITYPDDGVNGFHKLIYDLYGWTSTGQSPHFAFGGLLQSWNTNQDATGGTMHNVTVVDPREILQNFQLILNNHTGTTFGNDNLINIYGFLEHIYLTDETSGARLADFYNASYTKNSWSIPDDGGDAKEIVKADGTFETSPFNLDRPLTGIGYSLRSELGIPCFRVLQALNMLTGFHKWTPTSAFPSSQYLQYGGFCKFRNKKYAIDIQAIPIPDPMYQINYDTMSILDLCMELADACNHEIMVHLLPFSNTMTYPPWGANANSIFNNNDIDGIIKVTTINRNNPSGKVSASYIADLPFDVTSKDIGVELANEVTDRFVTGANEVAHYYFDGKQDRKGGSHGLHEIDRNLKKQIIPYYGLLHSNVVTFPRGRGPWTQIILDATSCNAMGVGEFYVTTEMELRAADISFDKWVEFLQSYNMVFHEVIFDGEAIDNLDFFNQGVTGSILNFLGLDGTIIGNRECTVPRCTHPPCKIDHLHWQNGQDTEQWCSPPYGYPLYWGRAGAIGLFTGSNTGGSNKNPKVVDAKGVAANEQLRQAKPKANSPKGGASNDANKNFEDAVSAYMTKKGLDNAKKVFAFVKAVADECLGKKFLIKIPQKPNLNYGSKKYFYGFPPRNNDHSIPALNLGVDGTYDYIKHTEHLKTVSFSDARQRGALTIGYNAAVGEYVFNYYPEPAGGNDPPYGTYAPPIIRSFFEENGRVPPYVRLPYEDAISMDSFDKDTTFKYSYNPITGKQAVKQGNGAWPAGTKHTVFVKADLDQRLFVAPVFKRGTVNVYGCTAYRRADLEGKVEKKKIYDEEGEEQVINPIVPKIYGPRKTPDLVLQGGFQAAIDGEDEGSPGVIVKYIDLDKALLQQGPQNYYHVYALITIPRAVLTEEGTETNGESMKVNASNVGHFFREDVVKGMPGFTTVTIPSAIKLEGGDDSTSTEIRNNLMKAVEGLSFCLDRRIKMFSPGPLFPEMAAIPLRSTERSYGPWFNETGGDGKIEYSHDESLAPWNYGGSYADMNKAGFMAVEQTAEADMEQERASFTMVGWPRGMSIGGFLSTGGPAITNINVSFSTTGIRTTVTMDSYTPSFGKMQKQKQALMTKMSRDKQKIKDQTNRLIKDQIINPRNNTTMKKEEAIFRRKAQAEKDKDYGSKLTAEDRGEAQPPNQFAMTVNVQKGSIDTTSVDEEGNATSSVGSVADANEKPDNGDFASKAMTNVTGAVQSAKATGDAGKVLSENAFQYYKQYWLSISSSIDEVFHPASSTWHNIFPCMDQPIDLLLYKDSIDDDNEISYYD